MVIKGSARGDAAGLAAHLLRTDTNEHVKVLELFGVAADDLRGALDDMELVGSGTRSKRPLYHASINTAPNEQLTDEQRAQAIDRLEKELGLYGQARAVVEHHKEGRTHFHIVWSRIDLEHMKAISDSHNFRRHEIVARELEREFGHDRVQGAHVEREGKERPERTPSHAEMQQAARTGLSPKEATARITEIWQRTDNGHSFAAALEGSGWILARGDRRDFVVIDASGETHNLARRIEGATAKDVRARMADLDPASLPSVAEARERRVTERQEAERTALAERQDEQRAAIEGRADLTDSTKGQRLSQQEARHDDQAARLEIRQYRERQRRGVTDPERDAAAARLVLPGEFARAAEDATLTNSQKDEREEQRGAPPPAPPRDESIEAFKRRQEADRQAAKAEPLSGTLDKVERAAERITDAPLMVMSKATRTGDKVLTRLTDFADSVLDMVAGAPPPRQIAPAELLMSPAARHEHRLQQLAEMEATHEREAALDRMTADRAAGRHLAADDVSRLQVNELENIKRYGDDYMKQLIDDHLRRRERGRGRERER